MRRTLDTLYAAAGALAAICLALILLLVAAQVGARMLDYLLIAIGLEPTRFAIPSLAEIAGFLLAAATFLALADTLAKNVHIRVDLLTSRLPPRPREILEGVVALAAAGIAGFATFAIAGLALKSFGHGDLSYGTVAVPLALPQAAMALGLAVLVVALLDESISSFTGHTRVAGGGGSV